MNDEWKQVQTSLNHLSNSHKEWRAQQAYIFFFFFLLSENAANSDSVAHGQLQKCPLFDQEPLVIAPFLFIARHNSVADFEPTGLPMESEF